MTALVQHPRAVELVERRKLRKKVARAVSRLIAILDELDSDPEAEPWLGASVVLYPAHDDQRLWARAVNDDREQEDEHGGDILDEGEESLGWAANVGQAALGPNTADGDHTAPERHGGGFVRCGADDIEPDDRGMPISEAAEVR